MKDSYKYLLESRPVRSIEWETLEDNLIVLVVPRFRNSVVERLLAPLLRKPTYRVKLDAVGSFIWRQCDGSATVLEIADRVRQRFGGDPSPLSDRLAVFIRKLARERFVRLNSQVGSA